MRFGIRTMDELAFRGRTVLCRVDINQPVDRENDALKSTARIEACLPTIRELSDKGARVVLLAHQGSDIEYKNYYSTRPHARVLSRLLGRPVRWIDDVCGPAARRAVAELGDGDILLLDNVRYAAEEQTLFEMNLRLTHPQQARTLLVEKLAPLADLYVCDAFAAAHRDQPSLCGFEQVLPSAMGRLFEKEYCVVSGLMEAPERPCVFVLGGAKISDAFQMMHTVLSSGTADRVLTGGLVANILLAAKGEEIGRGSMDFIVRSGYQEYLEKAERLYRQFGDRIALPSDLAYTEDDERRECPIGRVPRHITALDIGAGTAGAYSRVIRGAKTVFVNGPMGVFEEEPAALGTGVVWDALGETEAYTVIGGGDSIAAAAKFGQTDRINYICTGGGALIRFLTGEELPVVKALRHGSRIETPVRSRRSFLMFDPGHVFPGIAPIGWCNDDMPELGAENSFRQIISEMALAGFRGCEIGNKYPPDPIELRRAVEMRGMRVASRWFSSFLLTKPYEDVEAEFIEALDFLRAAGADRINVSEQSFSIQGRMSVPILSGAGKPVMDDAQWALLCGGLDRLGRLALERGFKLCYHHHMGTVVQTAAETDRLMLGTDPRYVFLCYDTGHFTFAGEDPPAILRKYVDRVGHVHLKDVRPQAASQARREGWSFLESVRRGVFTVPGDGGTDFDPVFRTLADAGYRGWLLVEAEQDPAKADPLEYAVRARKYIAAHTGL